MSPKPALCVLPLSHMLTQQNPTHPPCHVPSRSPLAIWKASPQLHQPSAPLTPTQGLAYLASVPRNPHTPDCNATAIYLHARGTLSAPTMVPSVPSLSASANHQCTYSLTHWIHNNDTLTAGTPPLESQAMVDWSMKAFKTYSSTSPSNGLPSAPQQAFTPNDTSFLTRNF